MMNNKKTFDKKDEKDEQQLCYEIRLKGHLDDQWSDWFDGMIITLEEDGDTLLTGPVIDQSELHGLLKKVRDIGIPLVSVSPSKPGPQTMSGIEQADQSAVWKRILGTSKGERKMDMNRKIARMVGVLFIIGTAAGILSLISNPFLNTPDYLVELSENKYRVILASLLVLTMGISLSMMTVVLYPVIRKYNETLALGAVVFRGALELVSYMGVVISWLLLLTLSQEYVSAGTPEVSDFQLMGTMMLDVTSQIGNMLDIVFSIGALIIYYVFYKTKLIPTWLSIGGLIGAVLYLASPILNMFGFDFEFLQLVLAVQEMVMAVWLIVRGFNPSAIASLSAANKTVMSGEKQ